MFLTRPHLADYMASAEEIRGRAADLFSAHRTGQLAVAMDTVFPLAEASSAHAAIEARATRGKLLLKVS